MDIDFLSLSKFVDGLIPGIIGGLVGRLSCSPSQLVARQTKRFNEITQPIRELLLQERNAYSPNTPGLPAVKAEQLEAVLPWWRRHDFHSTFNAYKRYKENLTRDAYGGASYGNFDEVAEHIDRLLRFTKRR